MARYFKETAHLNTDIEKYENNFDKIFGVKKYCEKCEKKTKHKDDICEECSKFDK